MDFSEFDELHNSVSGRNSSVSTATSAREDGALNKNSSPKPMSHIGSEESAVLVL